MPNEQTILLTKKGNLDICASHFDHDWVTVNHNADKQTAIRLTYSASERPTHVHVFNKKRTVVSLKSLSKRKFRYY